MSFFVVENIGIRFGGVVAVGGVSFSVNRGEVYTIIGPNGAGKTTIFNLIGLIYPPTSGRILFEPTGLYGRWLKIRTYFDVFPFYRRGTFRRQRSYLRSERLR